LSFKNSSGETLSFYSSTREVYNGHIQRKHRLPVGDYYLTINSLNYADYALTVTFTPEESGSFEVEYNNTLETANTLELGKTLAGNVDADYDYEVDYFKFDLTEKSNVTFKYDFKGGVPNHWVSLIQKQETRFSSSEVDIDLGGWGYMGNKPYTATASKMLEAGTYYIKISGGEGADYFNDYQLTVTAEPIEKPTASPSPSVEASAEPITELSAEPTAEPKEPTSEPSAVTGEEDTPAPVVAPEDVVKLAVGTSSWATEAVQKVIELNLAPVDLLGNWQDNITQEEFCRMAVQMLMVKSGSLENEDAFLRYFGITELTDHFNDTSNRSVNIAYELRIVSGNGNGQFNPNG
jgi:hypothetical protein